MEQLIHADIFFFVSTIALVCITAGVVVVLVYAIRILRDVRDITRRIGKESEAIAHDIEMLRIKVKEKGSAFFHLVSLFLPSVAKRRARAGRKKKAED